MIGKGIKNSNGTIYTPLAIIGDSALLHGGHDYVVIRDFTTFVQTGSWGNGTYFPCFTDEDSYKMLRRALYYLKHWDYIDDEEN